ncbi:MAG TPA: multicopper oxidase domain-containing protein [Salinimicrobium sp.]|nr:multicopper oxidase domain-containing protein [Salinimicrobium sp.]
MKKYLKPSRIICSLLFLLLTMNLLAQEKENRNVVKYYLTIDEEMVNITGEDRMGMTVNNGIPGPTLRFTEGDYAVIYVTNNMDVETSVHWHGLLVPNFMDGVPYLTTPPILPGTTFKYEFPIKQAGTYWYHSHTMLQEQRGVYGSIVIDDPQEAQDYDHDLVLVLADWTDRKPMNVFRNLKRGSEWSAIKKNTATPLFEVIKRGALGAQLEFWRQRMEGADISDIYYEAFIVNGELKQNFPEFEPGEKIRVRIINAASSTYFWLTFGGEVPLLIAADGQDVVPVRHKKTLIAIAETYDFIVTVPQTGKLEIRATAQDGTGKTSAYLGEGEIIAAPDVPRPDLIEMMKKMAAMDMKMGAPAILFNPDKTSPQELMEEYGMDMSGMHGMEGMNHEEMDMKENTEMQKDSTHQLDHDNMNHNMDRMNAMKKPKDSVKMDHEGMDGMKMDKAKEGKMNHKEMNMNQDAEMRKDSTQQMDMKHDMGKMEEKKMMEMEMPKDTLQNMNDGNMGHNMDNMKDQPEMDMDMGQDGMKMQDGMFSEFNYNYLKSSVKTDFDEDKPVKEVLLNLTGNMWRYIWSINGVPLNKADKIKIEQGQVVRITLNNLTMMHHPMHLHGHFFRVLNKYGEYSPLKHTVNVAPMQKVTIEFAADEYGDWFFHCHVLYHMMSGMARVYSYDTPRDPRLEGIPEKPLISEANMFFTWGLVDVASHMAAINMVSSNIRNQFNFNAEYGWNENLEAEFSYEYYLNDWFRVFGGVNVENEIEGNMDELNTTAVAGIRYFTPYMFNLDVRLDSKLRPQISLSREILIFRRLAIFGEYEFQADFGWVNELPEGDSFEKEQVYTVGAEYFLSRNFSLMASYDNRFGAGGGLSYRF